MNSFGRPGMKFRPVAWGRGFFRLWAVAAALWIAGAGWFQLIELDIICRSEFCMWGAVRVLNNSDILKAIAWVIAPPILVLAGGFVTSWIAKGFREKT
jgi:hypothetical protein